MDPLVKWVGGKRQLLGEILPRMPATYDRYFEPFFGGGAVMLAAGPEKAVINDKNRALIGLYRACRDFPRELYESLLQIESEYNMLPDMDAKRSYYIDRRTEYNGSDDFRVRKAALLVFLNKCGFNGVYRVNKDGLFNVPFGKRPSVRLCDMDNYRQVCNLMSRTEIRCGDFDAACSDAKAGDFVFFDSPYYDTFDGYQSGGFSEQDHARLAALFRRLSHDGVKCMLTNSDTQFIRSLYDGFQIEQVVVRRSVNRDASGRTGTEVIIRNY